MIRPVNTRGEPRPYPDHRPIVVPVLQLGCSCGLEFKTKGGLSDKAACMKHVRAERRKQLDRWRNGPKRDDRREFRARERRQRLACIPDDGAGTRYLAKLWNVAESSARSWLHDAVRRKQVVRGGTLRCWHWTRA